MNTTKLPVKVGGTTLERRMTEQQALRYGNRNMPSGLKNAGFETVIFKASLEINGWEGYRVNYGKRC